MHLLDYEPMLSTEIYISVDLSMVAISLNIIMTMSIDLAAETTNGCHGRRSPSHFIQDIISFTKVFTRNGALSSHPWIDRDSLFSHEFPSSQLSHATTFFFDINMIVEENRPERTHLMDLTLNLSSHFCASRLQVSQTCHCCDCYRYH
jgi:hypothetical protein